MDRKRINELARDLWAHVWTILDNEPELSAEDVGAIAEALEKDFRDLLSEEDE